MASPDLFHPTGPLPDLARSDAGTALYSTWNVGTPERQRATVDAITATWHARPWPSPDLLSYNVYAGTDGDTLMHYSQWTGAEAYHAFVREHRAERVSDIDRAVPDIQRNGVGEFRHYRRFSGTDEGTAGATTADPGFIVVLDIDFDAPDPVLRRTWIDIVIEGLRAEPHPGLISADFHLNVDGRAHLGSDRARVLNVARWTDEAAYEAAIDTGGRPADTAAVDRLRDLPGFAGSRSTRYRFARGFTPEAVERR
ncbi:antibiotic biosynthesis monooxygenase [Streptomyces cucumeris]|uniref:antibiotic biosynthesis monooxygenase n=1 Tax=Streptomyces cucumeris TaxID=2962890 RepID=UPI003D739C19